MSRQLAEELITGVQERVPKNNKDAKRIRDAATEIIQLAKDNPNLETAQSFAERAELALDNLSRGKMRDSRGNVVDSLDEHGYSHGKFFRRFEINYKNKGKRINFPVV